MTVFKLPDFYQVHLHGYWPDQVDIGECETDEEFSALGFHTARWVAALNLREAENKGREAVIEELRSRLGLPPESIDRLTLEIEECWLVGIWRYVTKRPGRGFTFYTEE